MKNIFKSESFNVPSRASFFYLGCGIVSKAIGILTTPIFTRILGSEEYGKLAFYLSSYGIAFGILSPLLSASCIYRVISKSKEEKGDLYLSALPSISAYCAVISIFLFTFNSYFHNSFEFSFILILQIFFDASVLFYVAVKRYDYTYKTVIAIMISEAALSPIFSIILITVFGKSYIFRAIGSLLSPIFITAILVIHSLSHGKKAKKNQAISILCESAPLVPSSLIGSVTSNLDRILTAFFLGSVAIAKYSVAHSIGVGLLFVVGALSSSFIPWILRKIDAGEAWKARDVFTGILTALCCFSVFLIALSPEAMKILAPIEYSEAVPAIMPIVISSVFSFVSVIGSAIIVRLGERKIFFISKLISLLASALFGYIFIPILSYLGAGLCVLLSELTSAVIIVLFLKQKKGVGTLVSPSAIPTLSILFAIAICLPLVYQSLALRILILTAPSVILLNIFYSSKGYLLEIGQKNIPH